MIKNKPKCRKLQRVSSDENPFFLNEVLNGNIIEATFENIPITTSKVQGTDVTKLDSNYLYICHYPYESVEGLLETDKAEVLIIWVGTRGKAWLKRIINTEKKEWESVPNFLSRMAKETSKNPNIDLDSNVYHLLFDTYKIKYKDVINDIKIINETHGNKLTNLDNFI